MTSRASDTTVEKTMGSTPTLTCWARWLWYSKVLWIEVWGSTGRKIRRQLRWLGVWTKPTTSWNNSRVPTRVMNLWLLITCDMSCLPCPCPCKLLERARRGVDDALRLDLWDDASPTAAGISMGSLLTFKLSKFDVGSELDIWTYHRESQRVSMLPATALTQPNSRGERFKHKSNSDAWIPNANHGSETKLAVKLTQLWNTDTDMVLHLKNWSVAVKFTTLEITLPDEIHFQISAVKLERLHTAVPTNW